MIVVLMGVTGSGKTTIGQALARLTGATFADADDFHSPANKARMAAGNPLTDFDRQPWLETLNHLLLGWAARKTNGILACSALKENYRTTLFAELPAEERRLVFLTAPPHLLEDRLAHRHHEYMNPALLGSQLSTLEPPTDALTIVNDKAPHQVAEEIAASLNRLP